MEGEHDEYDPSQFEEPVDWSPERQLWIAVLTLFVKDVEDWRESRRSLELEAELNDPWFEEICGSAGLDYRAFRDGAMRLMRGERDLSGFAFNRAAKRPRRLGDG